MKALNHKEISNKFWMFFIAASVFAVIVFALLYFTMDMPMERDEAESKSVNRAKKWNKEQSKIASKIDDINNSISSVSATDPNAISTIENNIKSLVEAAKVADDTAKNRLLDKLGITLTNSLSYKKNLDVNKQASGSANDLQSQLQSMKLRAETAEAQLKICNQQSQLPR